LHPDIRQKAGPGYLENMRLLVPCQLTVEIKYHTSAEVIHISVGVSGEGANTFSVALKCEHRGFLRLELLAHCALKD
jgi:hypothetical protein